MNKELLQYLQTEGYSALCIRGNKLCGICRFIYTVGVCYGLDETGYEGRYCFESELYARLFLNEWDGSWKPIVGEDGCTAVK